MATLVRFNVHADVRRIRAGLDDIGQRQLPYASARAINATLLAVQVAERTHLGEVFTLRRKPFVDRLVKINKAAEGGFATKKNPVGVIGIQGDRADVLAKFEQGGTKTPTRGLSLAIPVVGGLAKRRVQRVVPAELRPGALLGGQLLTVRAFIRPFKGDPAKRGIFVVDRVAAAKAARLKGQRGGKAAARRAQPALVYVLQAQAPIPADLRFVPIAREVIGAQFVPSLRAELAKAIATARTT